MTPKQMGLLQGTLDVLVLRALAGEARHGYAVAAWIRRRTDGALYTSLHRMERRGWLDSSWGVSDNNRRAKYYALTRDGRRALAEASQDWAQYAAAVSKVLTSGGSDA